MVNKIFSLKKMVIIWVFGLIFVDVVNAQTNDLSGIWITTIGEYTQVGSLLEMKFDNGNFTISLDGIFFTKGTYTANSGIYTIKTSSVYGTWFMLEAKWYSQDEIKTALKILLGPDRFKNLEEMFAGVDSMFIIETGTYSVTGNRLTMRKDGETLSLTYNRK